MKRILIYTLVLIVISNNNQLFAQTSRTDPNDFQAWAGVGLNLNLPKKWEAGFTYQLRMEGNAKVYKGSYFTPELTYNFNKQIKGFVNYRYAKTSTGHSSRFGLGAEYTKKISKLKLSFAPKIQYTSSFADDGDGGNSVWLLRTELMAKYALTKKLDAYVSFEPFFTFDKTEYFIDNIRNTIGVKYAYAKNKKLDLFYIYRPDFAKSYNRNYHIAGIRLDFDWKTKQKKASK